MSDTTYADGTHGGNSEAPRDLERDQHATFTDQPATVLALAYDAKERGITGHDVRTATGWNHSSQSRTMSELLRDGKLLRLAEKRDRGWVHVLPECRNGRPVLPYRSNVSKHRSEGYAQGKVAGVNLGLALAFSTVDSADSIGDALIALRRLIESRTP